MKNDLSTRLWSAEYSAADIKTAEEEFRNGGISGSVLSSIYYTIAGKEKAEGDKANYKEHLQQAVHVSDTFAQQNDSLTADELDVRQTILREAKRSDEALPVIEAGLKKPGLAASTKALLLIGQMEALFDTEGEKAEKRAKKIMEEVKALVETVRAESELQAIRVYRALARYAKRVGNRTELAHFAQEAQALIDANGAGDQERKLKHDLKE